MLKKLKIRKTAKEQQILKKPTRSPEELIDWVNKRFPGVLEALKNA